MLIIFLNFKIKKMKIRQKLSIRSTELFSFKKVQNKMDIDTTILPTTTIATSNVTSFSYRGK